MLSQQRFPHALLLEGMQGVGKKLFAFQLAQMLLCHGESETGICQNCKSCEWFIANTHPDFVVLEPEEGKKLISIEAVRKSSQRVFTTAHQDGYRILIIEPADAMTIAAANSLLKTLEEPPEQTLLLLITDKPSRLLPTIRSRATRIKFHLPSQNDAIHWLTSQGIAKNTAQTILALSLGAPLRFNLEPDKVDDLIAASSQWWHDFLALHKKQKSALEIAKNWAKSDSDTLLNWLDTLIQALIRSGVEPEAGLSEDSVQTMHLYPGIEQLSEDFELRKLFALRDNVIELSQQQKNSLNWPLQIESLVNQCQHL
ncbi:MAG: DNA polymerase III subunit delta' [Gammaproteobacteria bacterium]|nr:DNA polymerase III subunit delta' [Gammaproteobacteria bacterium]